MCGALGPSTSARGERLGCRKGADRDEPGRGGPPRLRREATRVPTPTFKLGDDPLLDLDAAQCTADGGLE